MQPQGEQKLPIEEALRWLRRELLEMQLQDQQLLEKLLKLHTALRELKVECADWESSDPSRDGFSARARSSSEDMGAPVLPRSNLKFGASRRNSLP
ncbi:uncharacterized protein C20orf202 homolog [Eublepharis macularius]|uniref:Uncharacterized protein C20orf202 homolog n=1 Tax=Eublepharis macularius TaxID=481883 RepID=A0AA97JHR3_EUBMA|nr:uncharacterized protein C20orf202 homolog [Eublepharis macularius]